jgi:uncharacterized protein (TIGR02145 family)
MKQYPLQKSKLMLMGVFLLLTTLIQAQTSTITNLNNNFIGGKGVFTDTRDNHTYSWVRIGTQVWMVENLAFKPATGKYWAFGDTESNVATYGYLYDWKTANKLCPAGWHLPSYTEWDSLVNYLGGSSIAGGKLKEADTTHWDRPNLGATNESGFTGLPGCMRDNNGQYSFTGYIGSWWSTNQSDFDEATTIALYFNWCSIFYISENFESGHSVRCIKD